MEFTGTIQDQIGIQLCVELHLLELMRYISMVIADLLVVFTEGHNGIGNHYYEHQQHSQRESKAHHIVVKFAFRDTKNHRKLANVGFVEITHPPA